MDLENYKDKSVNLSSIKKSDIKETIKKYSVKGGGVSKLNPTKQSSESSSNTTQEQIKQSPQEMTSEPSPNEAVKVETKDATDNEKSPAPILEGGKKRKKTKASLTVNKFMPFPSAVRSIKRRNLNKPSRVGKDFAYISKNMEPTYPKPQNSTSYNTYPGQLFRRLLNEANYNNKAETRRDFVNIFQGLNRRLRDSPDEIYDIKYELRHMKSLLSAWPGDRERLPNTIKEQFMDDYFQRKNKQYNNNLVDTPLDAAGIDDENNDDEATPNFHFKDPMTSAPIVGLSAAHTSLQELCNNIQNALITSKHLAEADQKLKADAILSDFMIRVKDNSVTNTILGLIEPQLLAKGTHTNFHKLKAVQRHLEYIELPKVIKLISTMTRAGTERTGMKRNIAKGLYQKTVGQIHYNQAQGMDNAYNRINSDIKGQGIQGGVKRKPKQTANNSMVFEQDTDTSAASELSNIDRQGFELFRSIPGRTSAPRAVPPPPPPPPKLTPNQQAAQKAALIGDIKNNPIYQRARDTYGRQTPVQQQRQPVRFDENPRIAAAAPRAEDMSIDDDLIQLVAQYEELSGAQLPDSNTRVQQPNQPLRASTPIPNPLRGTMGPAQSSLQNSELYTTLPNSSFGPQPGATRVGPDVPGMQRTTETIRSTVESMHEAVSLTTVDLNTVRMMQELQNTPRTADGLFPETTNAYYRKLGYKQADIDAIARRPPPDRSRVTVNQNQQQSSLSGSDRTPNLLRDMFVGAAGMTMYAGADYMGLGALIGTYPTVMRALQEAGGLNPRTVFKGLAIVVTLGVFNALTPSGAAVLANFAREFGASGAAAVFKGSNVEDYWSMLPQFLKDFFLSGRPYIDYSTTLGQQFSQAASLFLGNRANTTSGLASMHDINTVHDGYYQGAAAALGWAAGRGSAWGVTFHVLKQLWDAASDKLGMGSVSSNMQRAAQMLTPITDRVKNVAANVPALLGRTPTLAIEDAPSETNTASTPQQQLAQSGFPSTNQALSELSDSDLDKTVIDTMLKVMKAKQEQDLRSTGQPLANFNIKGHDTAYLTTRGDVGLLPNNIDPAARDFQNLPIIDRSKLSKSHYQRTKGRTSADTQRDEQDVTPDLDLNRFAAAAATDYGRYVPPAVISPESELTTREQLKREIAAELRQKIAAARAARDQQQAPVGGPTALVPKNKVPQKRPASPPTAPRRSKRKLTAEPIEEEEESASGLLKGEGLNGGTKTIDSLGNLVERADKTLPMLENFVPRNENIKVMTFMRIIQDFYWRTKRLETTLGGDQRFKTPYQKILQLGMVDIQMQSQIQIQPIIIENSDAGYLRAAILLLSNQIPHKTLMAIASTLFIRSETRKKAPSNVKDWHKNMGYQLQQKITAIQEQMQDMYSNLSSQINAINKPPVDELETAGLKPTGRPFGPDNLEQLRSDIGWWNNTHAAIRSVESYFSDIVPLDLSMTVQNWDTVTQGFIGKLNQGPPNIGQYYQKTDFWTRFFESGNLTQNQVDYLGQTLSYLDDEGGFFDSETLRDLEQQITIDMEQSGKFGPYTTELEEIYSKYRSEFDEFNEATDEDIEGIDKAMTKALLLSEAEYNVSRNMIGYGDDLMSAAIWLGKNRWEQIGSADKWTNENVTFFLKSQIDPNFIENYFMDDEYDIITNEGRIKAIIHGTQEFLNDDKFKTERALWKKSSAARQAAQAADDVMTQNTGINVVEDIISSRIEDNSNKPGGLAPSDDATDKPYAEPERMDTDAVATAAIYPTLPPQPDSVSTIADTAAAERFKGDVGATMGLLGPILTPASAVSTTGTPITSADDIKQRYDELAWQAMKKESNGAADDWMTPEQRETLRKEIEDESTKARAEAAAEKVKKEFESQKAAFDKEYEAYKAERTAKEAATAAPMPIPLVTRTLSRDKTVTTTVIDRLEQTTTDMGATTPDVKVEDFVTPTGMDVPTPMPTPTSSLTALSDASDIVNSNRNERIFEDAVIVGSNNVLTARENDLLETIIEPNLQRASRVVLEEAIGQVDRYRGLDITENPRYFKTYYERTVQELLDLEKTAAKLRDPSKMIERMQYLQDKITNKEGINEIFKTSKGNPIPRFVQTKKKNIFGEPTIEYNVKWAKGKPSRNHSCSKCKSENYDDLYDIDDKEIMCSNCAGKGMYANRNIISGSAVKTPLRMTPKYANGVKQEEAEIEAIQSTPNSKWASFESSAPANLKGLEKSLANNYYMFGEGDDNMLDSLTYGMGAASHYYDHYNEIPPMLLANIYGGLVKFAQDSPEQLDGAGLIDVDSLNDFSNLRDYIKRDASGLLKAITQK